MTDPQKGDETITTKVSPTARLDKLLALFGGGPSELTPILQRVQQEFGYLSEDTMRQIAWFFKIADCDVYGVATFYAQFKSWKWKNFHVQ